MNEVRTHIEKVVESLVGDNIDEASVLKLTDNPSCKFLIPREFLMDLEILLMRS